MTAAADPLASLSQRAAPAALEAEQALLGAILTSNAALDRVSDLVGPEQFADPLHARLFRVAAERIGAGRLVSAATLAAELANDPLLAEAGGAAYLGGLLVAAGHFAGVRDYAEVIAEAWARRSLIDAAAQAIDAAFAPARDRPAGAILEALDGALLAIARGAAAEPAAVGAGAAAAEALARARQARAARGGLLGVTSGLAAFDRLIGGFQPGNLYVIGARPGMGKTALAGTIAARAAAAGVRVLFASLEMTAASLGARLAAAQAGVPLSVALQLGRYDQDDAGRWRFHAAGAEDEARLAAAIAALGRLPLRIDFVPDLSVARLRARLRRMLRREGCGLVVIDYLGLMRASDRALRMASRVQEIADISRDLKVMAGELGLPVLLLSQLNREAEKREAWRPTMADLRDSGAVEQDAEVVALLFREEEYLARNEPKRREKETRDAFDARVNAWLEASQRARGRAELIVEKNRQGRRIALPLRFIAEAAFFCDPAECDGDFGAPPPALFDATTLTEAGD